MDKDKDQKPDMMDKADVVALMAEVPGTIDHCKNIALPVSDICGMIQEPLKVYCENIRSKDCIVESENIFTKSKTPIHFNVENVEKESKLTIEVKLENIDHKHIAILPCKICCSDMVFKVRNVVRGPPQYHLQCRPANSPGDDATFQVTFLKREQMFKSLPVLFYCSASHVFQNSRFRLMFKSKDKIVGMFLVEVTSSPKRSFDMKMSELKEESDDDDDELDSYTEEEEESYDDDDNSNGPKNKKIKLEPQEDEEMIFVRNVDKIDEIRQQLEDWKLPYKIMLLPEED